MGFTLCRLINQRLFDVFKVGRLNQLNARCRKTETQVHRAKFQSFGQRSQNRDKKHGSSKGTCSLSQHDTNQRPQTNDAAKCNGLRQVAAFVTQVRSDRCVSNEPHLLLVQPDHFQIQMLWPSSLCNCMTRPSRLRRSREGLVNISISKTSKSTPCQKKHPQRRHQVFHNQKRDIVGDSSWRNFAVGSSCFEPLPGFPIDVLHESFVFFFIEDSLRVFSKPDPHHCVR